MQQRQHDLVMSGEVEFPAAGQRRAGQHILRRSIVGYHVEVRGIEPVSRHSKITGDSECFQEDLRHYHRRSDIHHHATLAQLTDLMREHVKVIHAGSADCRAVCSGMLVDDVRAQCDMHGHGHLVFICTINHGERAVGRVVIMQRFAERFTISELDVIRIRDRIVDEIRSIPAHPETPIREPLGYSLGCASE